MGHRLCPALPDLGENKEVYDTKRNVAHGSAQATNIITTKKTLLKDKEKVFPYPEYHICRALYKYPVWNQNRPDTLMLNAEWVKVQASGTHPKAILGPPMDLLMLVCHIVQPQSEPNPYCKSQFFILYWTHGQTLDSPEPLQSDLPLQWTHYSNSAHSYAASTIANVVTLTSKPKHFP